MNTKNNNYKGFIIKQTKKNEKNITTKSKGWKYLEIKNNAK